MRRFEFDEDQRQAVDEADEIGAAFVHVARDPELRGEEEVVAGRVLPVDDADLSDFTLTLARSPTPLPSRVRAAAGRLAVKARGALTPSFNS